MTSIELDDLERDALGELVNIAVAGAAVRLRQMVGSEVSLTVPAISVATAQDAAAMMTGLGLTSVMAVRQSFAGRMNGQAILVFPQENYGGLVRAVIGPLVPEEAHQELAEDALGEIGNILLAGFLSTVGNMLRVDFDISQPVITSGQVGALFDEDPKQAVLFIYVNFGARSQSLRGYLALILSVESFAELQQVLRAFIVQSGG